LSLGITVSHTPGAVDEATATTALYLILSTLRHFSNAERSLHAGTWKAPISSGATYDLSTRTLGILGLGGIGLRLAHFVHAFPMRVVYYSRHRVPDAPAWCVYVDSLEALCLEADVLSVHVPLRDETVHLVGEREIREMKRGSVIVNTARGKVVDEEAMIRALEDGHVGLFFRVGVNVLMLTWTRAALRGGTRRLPQRTRREPSPARVPEKRAPPAYGDGNPGFATPDGGPCSHESERLFV
jgi:lactate dehydrogenase-like 2-hydroxyacid dehydrogenase